jgi:hypothetical protein
MEFVKILKSDNAIGEFIKDIKIVIYIKTFDSIIKEKNISSDGLESYNNMFSLVDKIYIVSAGCDNDEYSSEPNYNFNSIYDFDIYLLESKIVVLIHSPIAMKHVKNKISGEEMSEINVKKIIYVILNILGNNNSNSINNTNLFKNLLDCKERYFTNILFVFKTHPKSSINIVDLADDYFAVKKICINNKKHNQISFLFKNVEMLKSNQTMLKFIMYRNAQEGDERYKLRNLLEEFLEEFNVNKHVDLYKNEIKSNSNDYSQLLNTFIEDFLKFIYKHIFKAENCIDDGLIPITFSQKIFFRFMKLFFNFYLLNEGSLFKNILIIPLVDFEDEKYFSINKNNINVSVEFTALDSFIEQIRKFYFNDSFYYLIARNIKFYYTFHEGLKKIEKNSPEFMNFVKNRGMPFRRSKIGATLKHIEDEYEKVVLESNEIFVYSSIQIFSILYATYSKNYLYENLQNLRNQTIFGKIKNFLNINVNCEFYLSKSHFMEIVASETTRNKNKNIDYHFELENKKSEKISNNEKKQKKKLFSFIFRNQTQKTKIEKDKSNKNKKCLIF